MIDDEGSNISAGEKQLITIARAFLADPSLLILDEATSSVDTRTEVLVQHAMAALRADRTSFVIAHRLSTIRDADLILVMERRPDRRAGHARRAAGERGAPTTRCTTRSSVRSPSRAGCEHPLGPRRLTRGRGDRAETRQSGVKVRAGGRVGVEHACDEFSGR